MRNEQHFPALEMSSDEIVEWEAEDARFCAEVGKELTEKPQWAYGEGVDAVIEFAFGGNGIPDGTDREAEVYEQARDALALWMDMREKRILALQEAA